MKQYLVPVQWRVGGSIQVSASSPEEAADKALCQGETKDVVDAEYITDSWRVDGEPEELDGE